MVDLRHVYDIIKCMVFGGFHGWMWHDLDVLPLRGRESYVLPYIVYNIILYGLCIYRKRLTATEAIDHPFVNLAHHRGLGDRINIDKHKAYLFRRKWEVSHSRTLEATI